MRSSTKRLWARYIFGLSLVGILFFIYVFGLKQNKPGGTNFNLRKIHVKREVKGQKPDTLDQIKKNESKRINDLPAEQKKPTVKIIDDIHAEQKKPTVKRVDNIHAEQKKPTHEQTPVNVFVVEEHHEVIPYWFEAAEAGVIPKTGNTLIHIDGHSDMAPVMFVPGYPFFKWPVKDQLHYLMQRNDGFIQASSMAGLLNRVIWVWPTWDFKSHGDGYAMSTLSLGWTANNLKDDPRDMAFCMCSSSEVGIECNSLTDVDNTNVEPEDDAFVVTPSKCHVKQILIIEEVEERRALTYFSKKDWLPSGENVILDIDEDFYGCTYAVEPLLKANISMRVVKGISATLGAFMCPESMPEEKESEAIILDIITLIRKRKLCKIAVQSLSNTTACSKFIAKLNVNAIFIDKLKTATKQNKIKLCSVTTIDTFVKHILFYFNKMNVQQLHSLQTVGFCSSTSMKTFDLFTERRFRLCYGHNTPNQTAVTEHNPSFSEVKNRSVLLKLLLNKVKQFSPKLVTVCRSVRDGYTPRHFFKKIETDILTSLNKFLGKQLKINYDDGLLGGQSGWPPGHNNSTF